MYEELELSEKVRKDSQGSFIKLKHGFTHYQLNKRDSSGVEDTVVLVHGFSVPMFIWDPTYEFLNQNDIRVLRYDLYGRGLSDRPNVKYNADLFDDQLFELCQKLNIKNINIIGLSMGGIVSINFADRHSDLVKKISLEDPAGFPTDKEQFPSILKIPLLNKFIFSKIGIKTLIERSPVNLYKGKESPKFKEYQNLFIEQMIYKGFSQAILSTMLNMPMNKSLDVYKRIGKTNIPFQLFWGEFDEVLEQPNEEFIKEIIPNIEFHVIPNAGHSVNYEQPEIYNKKLLEFLKK